MRPRMIIVLVLMAGMVSLSGCARKPIQQDPEAEKKVPTPIQPLIVQEPRPSKGSIYLAGNSVKLFQDGKAYRVGDLLTVIIDEQTTAQKSANTSASKEQGIEFESPELFGGPVTYNEKEILSATVSQGSEFSGEGSSAQSNSLSGNITVVVADVLPNGNLLVRGEKKLSLNQGSEYIQLTGIVRPTDVKPDNTIESYRVANAEIAYSGEGVISDANSMGWQARFFTGPLWPF